MTCEDGAPVEGVWIDATTGRSDFAKTYGAGNSKRFGYSLSTASSWTVHVGCGGTPAHWAHRPEGIVTTTAAQANWDCVTFDLGQGQEHCRLLT